MLWFWVCEVGREQKRRGERKELAPPTTTPTPTKAATPLPPTCRHFFWRGRALSLLPAMRNRRDRRKLSTFVSMAPIPPSRKRARARKKDEGEEQVEGGGAPPPPPPENPTAAREPKPIKRTNQGPVTGATRQIRPQYQSGATASATERTGGQRPPPPLPRGPADDADADADDIPVAASASASAADTIDALLERKMREVVASRVYPSTACPSEVPRRLVDEEREAGLRRRRASGSGSAPVVIVGGDWRALMEPCREVARRLAREGALQITQRGRAITDLDAPMRGPIRLRPMPPPPPPS